MNIIKLPGTHRAGKIELTPAALPVRPGTANKRFGRDFKTVSFRWLSSDEI